MKLWIAFLICLSCAAAVLHADTGVLLPGDAVQPDPSVLSLDEVRVQIRMDHQHARVNIVQIFRNHTGSILEGRYVFGLPGEAAVSDFAVWDGAIRIPGVILERREAKEIYEQIRVQQIDPGLLQQEEGAEGPRMAGTFSARISPIASYGTKRLEIEYTQTIPVAGMKSHFSLPLKPDLYRTQKADRFSLSLELLSTTRISNFHLLSTHYPLQFDDSSETRISGQFSGKQVALQEDFALEYSLAEETNELQVLAYRGSEKSLRSEGSPMTAFEKPSNTNTEDGYFWASALLKNRETNPDRDPKSFVILLDLSSSMRWNKLEQAYLSLEKFLQSIPSRDEFLLITFHQETQNHALLPTPASPQEIQKALDFVRSQYLMGGTDFAIAFQTAAAAMDQLQYSDKNLILITDGNPTLTELQTAALLKDFRRWNKNAAGESKFRAFCFGIGNDTNRTLLSRMAEESHGYFEWVQETENAEFKLDSFLSKIDQLPVTDVTLRLSQPEVAYQVYPSEPALVYEGSTIDWFGRYHSPVEDVKMNVSGKHTTGPLDLSATFSLPEEATQHDFIPRGWAKRRVDALLQKIQLEGEDEASIQEIIALAKKYKFVTPYTSFLAAPRSLLRPRIIRPGDPLLRVRTDPSIVSVVAVFPFGLMKPLQFLPSEDIWQTRFLVPKEMEDGTHFCRLILRDKNGFQYEEQKSFLVDSRPPVLHPEWDGRFHPGNHVRIRVRADQDTRHLIARLEMLPPVRIEWDDQQKACVGILQIPADFPPGSHELQIIGEDFAHNVTRWSRKVEVH